MALHRADRSEDKSDALLVLRLFYLRYQQSFCIFAVRSRGDVRLSSDESRSVELVVGCSLDHAVDDILPLDVERLGFALPCHHDFPEGLGFRIPPAHGFIIPATIPINGEQVLRNICKRGAWIVPQNEADSIIAVGNDPASAFELAYLYCRSIWELASLKYAGQTLDVFVAMPVHEASEPGALIQLHIVIALSSAALGNACARTSQR